MSGLVSSLIVEIKKLFFEFLHMDDLKNRFIGYFIN